MHGTIERELTAAIGCAAVPDLLRSFVKMCGEYRGGKATDCLVTAGKFVENAFRILEYLRTGICPAEIKSPAATARELEKAAATLPEAIRLTVPRVLNGMIYEVRSKKGAVHVKGIDPTLIDGSLTVAAASWTVAELVRLFHTSDDTTVAYVVTCLARGATPFLEIFDGEPVVTKRLGCDAELLLLLASCEPDGLDRRALGRAAQYAPSTVTDTVRRLQRERLVHYVRSSRRFRITGPGSDHLADVLSRNGLPTI